MVTLLHEISVAELDRPENLAMLRRVFHAPDEFRVNYTLEQATEDTAKLFQAIVTDMEQRSEDLEKLARYLNQIVFCLSLLSNPRSVFSRCRKVPCTRFRKVVVDFGPEALGLDMRGLRHEVFDGFDVGSPFVGRDGLGRLVGGGQRLVHYGSSGPPVAFLGQVRRQDVAGPPVHDVPIVVVLAANPDDRFGGYPFAGGLGREFAHPLKGGIGEIPHPIVNRRLGRFGNIVAFLHVLGDLLVAGTSVKLPYGRADLVGGEAVTVEFPGVGEGLATPPPRQM